MMMRASHHPLLLIASLLSSSPAWAGAFNVINAGASTSGGIVNVNVNVNVDVVPPPSSSSDRRRRDRVVNSNRARAAPPPPIVAALVRSLRGGESDGEGIETKMTVGGGGKTDSYGAIHDDDYRDGEEEEEETTTTTRMMMMQTTTTTSALSSMEMKEGRRRGSSSSSPPTEDYDPAAVPLRSSSSASSSAMTTATATMTTMVSSLLRAAGGLYVRQLTLRPVMTKSLTAGIVFGLSDLCAQSIEDRRRRGGAGEGGTTTITTTMSYSRILTAFLVGVLFFGPAAHLWYEAIFRLLPSTSLASTLQKALLGQIFFGPAFTAVFFGAGMVRAGEFTLRDWTTKVRNDLPGVWASGLGYWPLVDFVSYKVVPVRWIPLFVNFCSFIWTIYLSGVANDESG